MKKGREAGERKRGSEVDSHRPSELSPRCFEIVGYRLASTLLLNISHTFLLIVFYLSKISMWVLLKFFFTTGSTKIIHLSSVFSFPFSIFFIYFHLTYRIDSHNITSVVLYSKVGDT